MSSKWKIAVKFGSSKVLIHPREINSELLHQYEAGLSLLNKIVEEGD
jgi:hypothetical protein